MISVEEQIKDAVSVDAGATAPIETRRKSRARRSVFWGQIIAFLFGLALLVFVIRRVGVQPIFDALGQIGFGLFIVIAINGLRHFIRAIALRTAVPPEQRRFNLWQAFTTRVGGEAVSFLTFTGPVLGEATKAALLRKRVSLVTAAQALVVDNLLYNLSVALFILCGACVMLAAYNVPPPVFYALLVIAVSASATLFGVVFALSRRVMPASALVKRLIELGFKRNALLARREHILRVEGHFYHFYRHRRSAFFAISTLDLLSHATSVLEVYVTLRMLDLRTGLAAPFVIESLTKVINFVFGFIPGTIGVYESGNVLILKRLGFAAATGLTLALVRKAGIIFWTVIGLAILAARTVPTAARGVVERHPRLHKAMDNLVLSNIAHRPARTLVSILGVGIGVLLIIFTVGLGHGVLRERGRREASVGAEILVRAAGTRGLAGNQPFALPVKHAAELAHVAGVRAAIPLGQTLDKAEGGFGNHMIDGINFDEYAAVAGLHLTEGAKLTHGDEAIVDTEWQKEHHAQLGDTIKVYERPFRVIGFYEPPGGARIKIPLSTMQDQLGSEGRCASILVAVQNPTEQDAVAERIHQNFPDDQIIFTRDLPELYAAGVPALNVFINVIVAVAAAISMLVILLAMYTTVTERTRQIGILKALGMSNTMIAWVIEQEALLVSLLGVGTGLLLTFGARFALMRASTLTVEIEPRWIIISLLIGIVGGTIGALYPALRAARQDAVDALSYE
ncbi:MAG: ABC transporter permease [Pyrinomonadaceae bacterium]